MRGSDEYSGTNAFESAKHACERIVSSANILAESMGKQTVSIPANHAQGLGTSVEASIGQDSTHAIVANPLNSFGRGRQSAQDFDMMMHADHPFDGDQQMIFYTEVVSAKDILHGIREPSAKDSSQTEKNEETQSSEKPSSLKSSLAPTKEESHELKTNQTAEVSDEKKKIIDTYG